MPSRHIPADTKRSLAGLSRNRCCLCRVVLLAGKSDLRALEDVLERHHIVFLSDSGDHSIDNLAVVCPTCHAKIHSANSELSAAQVRAARDHWYGLARVVPRVVVPPDAEKPRTEIPFRIHSLNLEYWITCSQKATVAELGEIIKDMILKPLGAFEQDEDWIACRNLALALQSIPEKPLDPSKTIGSIARYGHPESELKPGDSFVALVTRTILLEPTSVRIAIEPDPPVEGMPYRIIIQGVPPGNASLSIKGTDGYAHDEMVTVDTFGGVQCQVPGARRGVKDRIRVCTDLGEAAIQVEFQGSL